MLVLWILPFWTDGCFEEVVVGLLGEFGGGGDVVLNSGQLICHMFDESWEGAEDCM